MLTGYYDIEYPDKETAQKALDEFAGGLHSLEFDGAVVGDDGTLTLRIELHAEYLGELIDDALGHDWDERADGTGGRMDKGIYFKSSSGR
jgi:hypothetical protein